MPPRTFASVLNSLPSPQDQAEELAQPSEEVRHSLSVPSVWFSSSSSSVTASRNALLGFRYYGADNRPNNQTDVGTAQKWSQKMFGGSGVEIVDVVQKCLGCSFGPKPSFTDKRFREAVYAGVIQPLQDYLKTGQLVVP
jgi:hypothetical protein